MEEFALCIEYILLNRDRLTVPGLGTFVVQQLGAKYDLKEELFLPPIRIVRYDEQIAKGEETFFTSAIQQIYNISAQNAQSKLDVWIADFYQNMEDSGNVDLGCIGTFTGNANGHLQFTSSESGIATPAFYALDTFHIKRLTPAECEKKGEKVISNTGNTLVIRLPHRIMRYAAAACVSLLVLFGLSAPVDQSVTSQPVKQQSAVLSPTDITEMVTPASQNEVKKVAKIEETIPTEEVNVSNNTEVDGENTHTNVIGETDTSTEIVVTDDVNPVQAEPQERYYIVMASNVSNKNARNYVEVLKSRGFESARILEGKFNRVVVGEYATAEEARIAASDIKQKSKEYQGAWVYKQSN